MGWLLVFRILAVVMILVAVGFMVQYRTMNRPIFIWLAVIYVAAGTATLSLSNGMPLIIGFIVGLVASKMSGLTDCS
ncbi:MAG: hypothetical protein ACYDBB_11140 [Armatimonadota bacterium]